MAEQSLEQLEQEFHQIVSGIHPADVVTKGNAQKKWNSIAKPLHSLGKLEDHIMQIAALTGDTDVNLNRKALIVMCADNGIVEEGISQSGQEVTYQVAESMGKRKSSVCLMAAQANAKVIPIDVGIAAEETPEGVWNKKVSRGTKNFLKQPEHHPSRNCRAAGGVPAFPRSVIRADDRRFVQSPFVALLRQGHR